MTTMTTWTLDRLLVEHQLKVPMEDKVEEQVVLPDNFRGRMKQFEVPLRNKEMELEVERPIV